MKHEQVFGYSQWSHTLLCGTLDTIGFPDLCFTKCYITSVMGELFYEHVFGAVLYLNKPFLAQPWLKVVDANTETRYSGSHA